MIKSLILKKFIYLSLIIVFVSSCKKNYTCNCPAYTNSNGYTVQEKEYYYKDQKKEIAESACKSASIEWNNNGGPACELINN